MPVQLDLATALGLSLDDVQESKFMALKTLHSKKVRQLMISIDAKEKEIMKLHVLNKDSNRAKMIQLLRNKIRSMETLFDYMKDALGKKGNMSREEVNEFINLKMTAGPKRFRPLTREELENKVIALEKTAGVNKTVKVSNSSNNSVTSNTRNAIVSTRNTLTNMKNKAKPMDTVNENSNNNSNNKGPDSLVQTAHLMEQINELKSALDVCQGGMEAQQNHNITLRQRNKQLVSEIEHTSIVEAENRDLRENEVHLKEELEHCQVRIGELTEQNNQLTANSSIELETTHAEMHSLQTHCEKLLKQNANLLEKLGDMELELEEAMTTTNAANEGASLATKDHAAKAQHVIDLEKKLVRALEKLKMSDQLIKDLQNDNGQILVMKESLREKNVEIKELKKIISDLRDTSPVRGRSVSPNKSSNNDIDTTSQLLEMKLENKRLKEALTAANSRIKSSPSRTNQTNTISSVSATTGVGNEAINESMNSVFQTMSGVLSHYLNILEINIAANKAQDLLAESPLPTNLIKNTESAIKSVNSLPLDVQGNDAEMQTALLTRMGRELSYTSEVLEECRKISN